MKPTIKEFFDKDTFTLTYVVTDEATKDSIVIDSVLDYDPVGSSISMHSYENVKKYIQDNSLNLKLVMETHAHADHISAAPLFKRDFPGVKVVIGEKITLVQDTFKGVFNIGDLKVDGSQFDYLIKDGEEIEAGSLKIKSIATPGHTPACSSYLIGDALFTGDALFMPDSGTGRCDFPKGDSSALYDSIHEKLYSLPDETRVFVGHDYQPNGRGLEFQTTIGEEKEKNIQLKAGTSKEQFVEFRNARDAKLKAPHLLFPSIQANIDGGSLPESEDNGVSYFKIPIKK